MYVDNRLDKNAVSAAGLELGGYVGADNEAGGELAGKAMVQALDDKGFVVVIEGIRGVDNAEARKRGFEKAVKGYLTILDEQSADWMTEKAQNVTQNLLAMHPDVHGVFCANDEMAIGAIKAINLIGGGHGGVKVVSYDNIKEVKPYLKSHDLYATIEQHPDLMGSESLRLAVAILDGKVKKGQELLVNLETITK
jgi:ribose transport system substrate-binding protein